MSATLQETRTAVDQAVAAADGDREWSRTHDWLVDYLIAPEEAATAADEAMRDAGWYRTRTGWRKA